MASDKYISYNSKTSGYTFANIGLFYGLAGTIFSAVYSLILFEIFGNASVVGLYSAAFAGIATMFALFSSEIFRLLPKAKILPISIITIIVATFGMVFQPSAGSFIALDIVREVGWSLLSMSLSLLMIDFSGMNNIARVQGRYYTLYNLGSIIAPIIAMRIATIFGNERAPLVLVSLTLLIALLYYNKHHITALDKAAKPARAKKTLKKIFGNFREFVRGPGLPAAYAMSFGYYAIQTLRSLYVPIIVIQAGFTKDTLGLVLALGTIPFALLASPISKLSNRIGAWKLLMFGFAAYAAAACFASISTGVMLLGLFVLWQLPNAIIEPLKELPFYAAANRAQQTKFIGIFRTSKYLAGVIAPLLAAATIALSGATSSVWLLAATIGFAVALIAHRVK